MNLKLNIIATCIMLLASASCKKAQDKQSAANTEAAIKKITSTTGVPMPNLPNVENGILVLESEGQFEQYMAFLDAVIDPQRYDSVRTDDNGDTLEFDQDAILETIESYLGFTSARKISHDRFMQLNEIGWATLEEIPEEHFIPDLVLRSILNENLTVKMVQTMCTLSINPLLYVLMFQTRNCCMNSLIYLKPLHETMC